MYHDDSLVFNILIMTKIFSQISIKFSWSKMNKKKILSRVNSFLSILERTCSFSVSNRRIATNTNTKSIVRRWRHVCLAFHKRPK